MSTLDILKRAKAAAPVLATLTESEKNRAINTMADALEASVEQILDANKLDVERARGKISDVMIDRLALTEGRVKDMASGMRKVADLPDPVWNTLERIERPDGLVIEKKSVPIGVVAIIYESRPNVTSDAAVLSFKSGNVCVLRSGKEAWRSANAVTDALRRGLVKCGLNEDYIQLIEDTTRDSANELMRAAGYVDLLIPRGGAGLIRACVENAIVPCIETGTGICHIYVDETADMDMALDIIENAKTSRPSVCNAQEVCLVNRRIAEAFLPKLKERLVDKRSEAGKIPVELRLDREALGIIDGVPAGDRDFDTEFLDYILAVSIVDNVGEAIEHITIHSTKHSDGIVTRSEENTQLFMRLVDSAAVYVNASTRFTDGGEFGLGCEMGISTQKLHARGPMGLKELTTYKYIVRGNGNIR